MLNRLRTLLHISFFCNMCDAMDFYRINGKISTGRIIRMIVLSSSVDCLGECLYTDKCNSFNTYSIDKGMSHECVLLEDNRCAQQISSTRGSVYYSNTDCVWETLEMETKLFILKCEECTDDTCLSSNTTFLRIGPQPCSRFKLKGNKLMNQDESRCWAVKQNKVVMEKSSCNGCTTCTDFKIINGKLFLKIGASKRCFGFNVGDDTQIMLYSKGSETCKSLVIRFRLK